MASARPLNRAHSPRNSERIVTTTWTAITVTRSPNRVPVFLSHLNAAANQQIDEKRSLLATGFFL